MKKTAMEKRLRIYVGEDDRWFGQPLHDALLALARREGLRAGAAVRGAAGFGSKGTPVVVEIVDQEAKIEAFLPKLEEMLDDAFLTLEDVSALRIRRSA